MENIILTNNKDLRLVSVKVGVLSTLRFELPLVSASATHVEVIVTSGDVHSAYTATFIPATRFWQCDIAASQFPAVGKQSYEVAYVLDGKQFWDGKGWIEIEDATTSGIEPQPRPEPYRYTVLSVNGYGADEQGAVRIPKTFIATDSPATTEGYIEGDIYFNRETGATWTLCNVLGTLTWVFNYKNYYTKSETEEAIDRVSAYYITYDAAGNPFPTYASLANAQTVYSGGAVRTPTRNDYCVVLADETHDGAEYRYIYAVAEGQTTGSWQPQFPVEGVMTVDQTVQKNSPNPVSGGGVWSALWGMATTAFSSVYDWCVAQLAGKASTADATLTERFSAWTISGDVEAGSQYEVRFDYDYEGTTLWGLYRNGDLFSTGSDNPLSTSEDFHYGLYPEEYTITATRTALSGYQLGSQTSKSVASEAEAEALRTGKQNALTAQQLANIAAVSDALAFDATHSYAAGDPVVYNGTLYTFTAAHTGAWTGSDVSAVDIIARLALKANDANVVHTTGGETIAGALTLLGSLHIKPNPYAYGVEIDNLGWLRYNDHTVFYLDAFTLAYNYTDHYRFRMELANGTYVEVANTDDLLAKLDSTSAAPAFSSDSSVSYPVDSRVTYNGKLYKCTTATTGGTWDASNWTADTMTDPDAVLDITAQNQLRVVAKDGTVLWAQGYDLASTSSATLACDATNNFTFADGATTQAFTLPTAPTGKVGDFGLDIDNSANTGAATMTLTGLDTTFSVVVPEGESLNDMLAIAAGELARFYVSLSTFRVNNLPTWHIVKQIVENGGATV